MKIGANSRYFLELVTVLGFETLEALVTIPCFYKTISCSSEDNFWRRARSLQTKGLLTLDNDRDTGKWVSKLTQSGQASIDKGINPEAEWNTPWDGQWRLFAFDLPKDRGTERQALRKWLKQKRLGKLQGSLWITPKYLSNWTDELADRKIDPAAAFVLNGKFEGGSEPTDYVATAWDFDQINERYATHQKFLNQTNPETLDSKEFPEWFQKETALWRIAFETDPFLPRELWPTNSAIDYQGPQALANRKHAYNTWKHKLLNSNED